MHDCPIMHQFCEFHLNNPTKITKPANKTMRGHISFQQEVMEVDGLQNKIGKHSTTFNVSRITSANHTPAFRLQA